MSSSFKAPDTGQPSDSLPPEIARRIANGLSEPGIGLGLISPERRGTTRVYRRRDRTRLNLILRGKRLGFPLEEIRTIIDLYDRPRGKASQLEYVLGQIDERRSDLEQRRRDIEDALAELDRFERRCREDLSRLG